MTTAIFNRDASLETKLSRQVKAVLGNYFFSKDMNMDLTQGTDFLIMSADPVKVAVRIRRPGINGYYLKNYGHQFTIRQSRPSGAVTEYQKIMDGLVNYILYGFCNSGETRLETYFLADLDVFRTVNPDPVEVKVNDPPDSRFNVYQLDQFPADFIRHRYFNPSFDFTA